MYCKCYHIIFSTFSWKFKCKICVQKKVIHNFKNHILVTWNWCGFENRITIILFKIWPTNRFAKAKSYNFHFHKNDVTRPLSANSLLGYKLVDENKIVMRDDARFLTLLFVRAPPPCPVIESLSNDDGDGNGNSKNAIGLISKTTTLHVHHAFWYISLPSLHDYNVKLPNFTFCRGREHKTTTFFFFSWRLKQSFRIQLPKNFPAYGKLNEMK